MRLAVSKAQPSQLDRLFLNAPGLGEAQGKMDCKAALVTLALVLIVVVVEGTAAVLLTGSPKP